MLFSFPDDGTPHLVQVKVGHYSRHDLRLPRIPSGLPPGAKQEQELERADQTSGVDQDINS